MKELDGTWHIDSLQENEYTLLYYPHYKWKKEWGGNLEIDIDGDIQTIEVKPGRMVLLDATRPHRAFGPAERYIYRFSIAYRLMKEN